MADATSADRDTAIAALNDQANVLEQVLRQAMAGSASSRAQLQGVIDTAKQYKDIYASYGLNITVDRLDIMITAAQNYLAGKALILPGSPGLFSRQGMRLGRLVVPWAGVLAGGLFVAGAIYFSRPRRSRRREW